MFNTHCGHAGAHALRKRITIAHELCAEAANHFSSRDHEKALQTLSLARKIAAEAELIIAGGVLRRSMWSAFRKLLFDLRSRIESIEPDTLDARPAWNWSHKPNALARAEDETRRQCGAHAVDRSHESIYETSSSFYLCMQMTLQ